MTAPEPGRIVWHTSSYSYSSGNCVEIGWRTSSYSGGNGDCVEVAPKPDGVLVRDSKDRHGSALAASVPAGTPSCAPSPADLGWRWTPADPDYQRSPSRQSQVSSPDRSSGTASAKT
jgi:hypothetical protein